MAMGYKDALEAAGAKVLDFDTFGDYQGSWFAIVEHQDKRFVVQGSFGSCSECDSFEHEFNWDADEEPDYQVRLAKFGKTYLDDPRQSDELIALAEEDRDWDTGVDDIIHFLEKAKKKFKV